MLGATFAQEAAAYAASHPPRLLARTRGVAVLEPSDWPARTLPVHALTPERYAVGPRGALICDCLAFSLAGVCPHVVYVASLPELHA